MEGAGNHRWTARRASPRAAICVSRLPVDRGSRFVRLPAGRKSMPRIGAVSLVSQESVSQMIWIGNVEVV